MEWTEQDVKLGFPEHCWHWVGGQLQCCYCGLYQGVSSGAARDGHGGFFPPNMVSLGTTLRCYGRNWNQVADPRGE